MKTNKLISSMAISLTTVFVALGITVYYSYVAVGVFELLGSGTLPIEFVPYLLALLCMLAASGIIIYLYIAGGTPFLEILLEGSLYIGAYLIGGIALFIAFIKNCSGMRAPKNQGEAEQTRPVPPPPPVPPMYNNQ